MLTALLILCALIWLPIFLYSLSRWGFVALMAWLLIAPIATNVVRGQSNPLFTTRTEGPGSQQVKTLGWWEGQSGDVKARELFQPTRLVICSLFGVLLLSAVFGRNSVLPPDKTEIWMALFSLILVTNIVFQSHRLLYSLRFATDGFIVPFAAYYVSRRLVRNEHQLHQLTRVLTCLGSYLIVIGLVERLAHGGMLYRLSGPFNSGTAYYYVLMAIFFAVLAAYQRNDHGHAPKQLLPVLMQWFVLAGTPVVILLIWSRGAWLGFLLGVWVFVFLGYRLINSPRRLTGVVLLIVPLVVAGIFWLVPEVVMERRVLTMGTVNWRFVRWNIAIELGTQNPIFGVGFSNLLEVFGGQLGTVYSAHNFFLTLFAELGIAGLLAYLAALGCIFRTAMTLYRKGPGDQDRWRGITMIAVITASLAPALFANTMHTAGVVLVYMYVFLGGIGGMYSQDRPAPVSRDRLPHPVPYPALLDTIMTNQSDLLGKDRRARAEVL